MSVREPVARRIVVAFDPYMPDRTALRLAQRLALLGAQSLHALYVEETEALTLGSFPWAREIATATAESRPLHREAVERGLSGRAAEARTLFEAAAAGLAEARFERVRGRLAEELKRTAADAAGVLLEWPPASRASRTSAATIVRTLLELQAPLVGLVGPRGVTSASVVVVASDERAAAARELAERLAAPAHARITQLQDATSAAAIIARARAVLAGTVVVQRSARDEEDLMLADLALEWPGSLLLLR